MLDWLDERQRRLLFAALNLLALLQPVPELRRVVGFRLWHRGLGLKLQAVAPAAPAACSFRCSSRPCWASSASSTARRCRCPCHTARS